MLSAALDTLATEQAVFASRQAILRRFIASDLLKALAQLSNPRKRQAAIDYLLGDGQRDLLALGIRPHRLNDLIDNPPHPRLLKVSNGRRPRAKLHGLRLRKLGKRYQEQVGATI
jgi:hypothetical protein